MTAQTRSEDDFLTVDELAAATGLTVRTTRYYAGLGLLPPPIRRGRMAYYGPQHRARLELVRALQDHGFTLSAIERYLAKIAPDTSIEELALQRVMMTSWSTVPGETLSRRQLDERAGRVLGVEDLELLSSVQGIRREGDRYELLAPFEMALAIIDLDIPREAMVAASAAIASHMDALADELTTILHDQVLQPLRHGSGADNAHLDQTMSQLRRLTLEAVVAGFQRAANQVISRSLGR